jgi:hypothetical protein
MQNPMRYTIVVNLVHGEPLTLTVTPEASALRGLWGGVEQQLKHLFVLKGGKLLMIPEHNIQSIEITPVPKELPRGTVKSL